MPWIQAGNRWINLDNVREVREPEDHRDYVRVIYIDGFDIVLAGDAKTEFMEAFQDRLFIEAERDMNPADEVRIDIPLSRQEYDFRYGSTKSREDD